MKKKLDDDIANLRRGLSPSTPKRVRMIFSAMASPSRIDILRILNSNGSMTYSELKALAGFRSKKESGKFAYHLRKIYKQSLVVLNKAERRYTVTALGILVLSLTRQIEARSGVVYGKTYVRTLNNTISEFDPNKIILSLIREGNLAQEVAEKIAEEVENRIYKYHITHLTGSLIRELINSVLLEHSYEDYRSKMARMGMPVHDVYQILSNVDDNNSRVGDVMYTTGQRIFAEYLLSNVLSKDVSDSHLFGNIHLSGLGTWAFIPDMIFANIQDLAGDGIDMGGKQTNISRLSVSSKQPDLVGNIFSILVSLISKEASQEIILEGLAQMFENHTEENLEQRLVYAFASASATIKHDKFGTTVSFVLHLNPDIQIAKNIIAAYTEYTRITPKPPIGLIIDHKNGNISDILDIVSRCVMLGGRITLVNGILSSEHGILNMYGEQQHNTVSMALQSVSFNLPRLAFESDKDELYFRTRLALLMENIIPSLIQQKKEISDLIRKGFNPILTKSTKHMQSDPFSIIINLTGLKEAVFGILGYENNEDGRKILYKVAETAVSMASKKGKEFGARVGVCMIEIDDTKRFIILDGTKYGKKNILNSIGDESYSQGVVIPSKDVLECTPQSTLIEMCNKFSQIFNGGVLVTLQIDKGAKIEEIKDVIKKMCMLVPSFKPVKEITICGECGYKDESFEDDEKCPRCRLSYAL